MARISHPVSPHATEAVVLLGQLIRKARIERRMSVTDVTTRAGISRGLLRRIETGDTGCTIGVVFEVATLVGVRLFDVSQTTVAREVAVNREVLALLPKAIRNTWTRANDDF